MAHVYEAQTLEVQGFSQIEYRYSSEPTDTQLITFEFTPTPHPLDNFVYSQPQYVFGELVALKEQYDAAEALDYFCICALELVEPRNSSGWLTQAPYWLYGIRCSLGTGELIWFEEEELISKRQIEQDKEDLNEF